ncbi:MAG TPA: nuclear transport factor 2 family protein [Bacteroidota bacterium]|nr:nuclear transport factor 2 family protein [Bacteroidota bacterium]
MENIEATLLALHNDLLAAIRGGRNAVLDDTIADAAIAVLPSGVIEKEEIVRQMTSAESAFQSGKVEDMKVLVLTEDCGLVTCRTMSSMKGETPVDAFITAVYVKMKGTWKAAFSQQTPCEPQRPLI